MRSGLWKLLSPLLIAALLLLPAVPVQAAPVDIAARQDSADEPDDWQRIQDAGRIVFGTAANYPPFEFYNSVFELDGFDIALAKALSEELGVEVVFNDYAFDGLLNAVQLGEVDAAIGAISATPDRRQVVDFSNLYYIGDAAAVAGTAFTGTVRSATDLMDVTVGAERGTTFLAWAQENLVDKGVIPQENLKAYPDTNAVVRELRNGNLDVGLMGLLTAETAVQRAKELRIIGDKFNQQRFAIAVPEGSNLATELNEALLAVQSNGTFAALVESYLQVEPESVTPDEEAAAVDNTPITPAEETTPTETPCIDGMAWVADLTLDDQNMTAPPVMAPGQDFTKSWRVRNSGTCTWEPDYELTYVNGNRIEAAMGGSTVPVGVRVEPGQTLDISVNLRAPQVYGTFQGFWQMRNSLDQYFGEVVWVGIQVPDPNPPPPPPPPPPSRPDPNLRADNSYIDAGQCTTIRWDVDNVNAVYFIEGGNTQGVGGHDARNVCPGSTTTYTLRVVYSDGSTSDFPITINVNGNAGYSINFWADNPVIDGGQCTWLRWDVRNVQAVYLDGEGVPGVSAREVCPGGTQNYVLSVVLYGGGQDSRQVTITVNNVAPPPQEWTEIERFTVNTNQIHLGECVSLEWRTDNANGVNLLRNGGIIVAGGSTNGSHQDCPSSPGLQEYRLDAYGSSNASQSVTVDVSPIQPR